MRQNRLRKKALSALLALSLFSTPLLTAQAAGPVDYSAYNTAGTAGYSGPPGSNPHGSPAELIFDTGYGPGVNASSVPGWRALTQTGRYYIISGTSGQVLNSIAPFAGNMAAFAGASSSWPGGKPVLPWGQNGVPAPNWTGYTFKGWSKLTPTSATYAEVEKVENGITPVIPYAKKTVYAAKWVGSASYKMFTQHRRKPANDFSPSAAPWVFDKGEDSIVVDNDVSYASVELPGYKVTGATVTGTGSTDATLTADANFVQTEVYGLKADGSTTYGNKRFALPGTIPNPLNLSDKMPNQNVRMIFDYEPDENQKFKFSTSYVYLDATGAENTITVRESTGGILGAAKLFSAESDATGAQNGATEFSAPLLPDANNPKDNTPAAHPKYLFHKAEIVAGKDPKTLTKTVAAGGAAETFVRQRGLSEALFGLSLPADDAAVPTPVKFKWMPNQDVKVKYTYKLNPDYRNSVRIIFRSTRDDNAISYRDPNVQLSDVEKPTDPTAMTTVTLPYVPNYKVSTVLAKDSTTLDQQPTNLVQPTATAPGSFQYKSKTDPAEIVVSYEPIPSAFAKVYYTATSGGSLGGIIVQTMTTPKNYTLTELLTLHGITVTPDTGYISDGWYPANAGGNAPVAGSVKIEPTDTLTLTAGDKFKYVHVFKKDPNAWGTVSFISGPNGSITGTASQSVLKNTALNTLAPTVTPAANYEFEGWYSGNTLVSTDPSFGSLTVQGNAQYTAKFVLQAALYDMVFAAPNVDTSVSGVDGTGQIKVNTPNAARNYAVTDEHGNVLAVMTGTALATGNFTGLKPGQPYHVYELASDQTPAIGSDITLVPANKKGPETLAVIPPTQPNLTAVPDPASNTASITVNPAEANSQYALVDDAGNTVAPGFVSPTGGSVVFTGLDPARSYTVVAQPNGAAQDPAANAASGYGMTVPAANQTAVIAADTLTVKIQNDPANSGRLLQHIRGGAVLPVADEKEIDSVKSGDNVMISADATNASGAPFERWELLSGNVLSFNPTMRSQSVTVNSNAIFEPIYRTTLPANTVELKVESSDHSVGVAEAVRLQKQDDLNNPQLVEDSNAWASNSNATYTIKLQKSAASAAVKQAVADADANGSESSFRVGWMVDVKLFRALTRTADGAVLNRPVPDDAAGKIGQFNLTAALDNAALGKIDYALYAVKYDGSGNLTAHDLSSALPADFATNPSAIYEVPVEIGDKLVLSYHKAVKFRLVDARNAANNAIVALRKGSKPAENASYTNLPLDFTVNLDNGKYYFKGLSTTAGSYTAFDPSTDAVNADQTVYAYYEVDPAWTAARAALDASRAIGTATLPNVQDPALQAALQAALNNAAAVSNAVAPSSSIAAMQAAMVALNQAISDATAAPVPTPTPTPTPTPIPTPTPGGGGSSGGGGGGGGGRGSRGGGGGGGGRGSRGGTIPSGTGNRVYQNGVEGNWVNFDPAGHGWYFDLGLSKRITASWADVAYTYGGETKIYSYHFDENGVMDSGWWKDDRGVWYHLSTNHDGWFGSMDKGWYLDSADGKWYYLNIMTGSMLTGWQEINGNWYYFNESAPMQTWDWDATANRWVYANRTGRPYGSMYVNEVTPDGYHVDASGAWIRETP